MRTLLAALTALMLFATPVVAGDYEDAEDAFRAGDYQKAFRLWKPLAEQGDEWAQFAVGNLYDSGDGVPEDNVNAVHWYLRAAEQGYAVVQYNLGLTYDLGQGVFKDDTKAIHWYREAAERGYVSAQHNLGVMYRTGNFVLIFGQ